MQLVCVVVSSRVLSFPQITSLSIQLVLDCLPIRNLIPHVPEKSLGLSAIGTIRFTSRRHMKADWHHLV